MSTPRRKVGLPVIATAFFVPTMGYATTVTSIPGIQARIGVNESVISILLLMTLACAAGGSVCADRIAVRWGSRHAVVTGLALQAVALSVNGTSSELWALIFGLCGFGVGLGLTDASASMQGALAQRHREGRPVFGRLYAAGTSGAILGSLLTSGSLALAFRAGPAMLVAAALCAIVAIFGWFAFDRSRESSERPPRSRRSAMRHIWGWPSRRGLRPTPRCAFSVA